MAHSLKNSSRDDDHISKNCDDDDSQKRNVTDGVYFGFEQVDSNTKASKVQKVFSDVATQYDLMNDIMSFGLHRAWKNEFISLIPAKRGKVLLDLAGGTGDIACRFLDKGGARAVVCDSNLDMLQVGRRRCIDSGLHYKSINWVHGSGESLPFNDNTFDCCTISFGIRNFTDINAALLEVHRVLKPCGMFLCLEFSHIKNEVLNDIYNFYSFKVIPKIGKVITGHSEHYKYLVESIRKFPKANRFARMVESAGFTSVNYKKLCFGVVAIHYGYKI